MPGVRQIVHKDKEIFVLDLANCEINDVPRVLVEARALIFSLPIKSVLAITDVTGAKYNRESVNLLRDYASATALYTKAGAMVGVTDLKRIIYNTIMAVIGKNYPCFDTREKALDWLVKQ